MAHGVPLLTAVPRRHGAARLAFTGGARVLPANADDLQAWLDPVLSRASQPMHGKTYR